MQGNEIDNERLRFISRDAFIINAPPFDSAKAYMRHHYNYDLNMVHSFLTADIP